jgi:hypothetical protein
MIAVITPWPPELETQACIAHGYFLRRPFNDLLILTQYSGISFLRKRRA